MVEQQGLALRGDEAKQVPAELDENQVEIRKRIAGAQRVERRTLVGPDEGDEIDTDVGRDVHQQLVEPEVDVALARRHLVERVDEHHGTDLG